MRRAQQSGRNQAVARVRRPILLLAGEIGGEPADVEVEPIMPIQGTIAPTKAGREQPPNADEIRLKMSIDRRLRPSC